MEIGKIIPSLANNMSTDTAAQSASQSEEAGFEQHLKAAMDKKDDKGNYTQIAFDPLNNRGADIWQYLNDTSMIAPDGTPQINNPKMVEVLTWIKKWVDRYGGWDALQKFESQFGAPPNDNFMANGIAMRVDIFGYESALEFYRPTTPAPDGSKPRMAWGVGLMPHNTGAKDGDWSGGFALSIPKGAKNPEAAWEFIKCVTSAQGQASWARDTLAQPTNIEAARDPILSANPFWPIVDKALSVSTGGVYLAKYPNYTEQLSQRYEKVWTGELTPQQALDEAQQAVLDAIK
jgi:multiple sugar transport system substrate-binding protein